LSSEEAAHFCLLEHADPEDVLLIGGGVGGLCDEILKYGLKSVDYVELDPAIIKTAEDIFPEEYTKSLTNRKITIHNADGRYFVKTTDKKYDCIIVHLGDPYTAQLGRFYTHEFFAEAGRILKKGGVISFYLTASESYLNKDSANFLRSIYLTLKDSFPEVIVIPGETAYFLASNIKGALTYDYNVLMRRARERAVDLKYVREYYLFSRMNAEKISYFENVLKGFSGKNIGINYDFRPSAYYYGIISWSSRFRDSAFTEALRSASEKKIWMILALFCLSALLLRNIPLFFAACAGFSQMSFQMILLFSFQVIYGYLFYKLGLLFTFFMLGLALSSYWMSSEMQKVKNSSYLLALVQTGICAFALILPASLEGFSSTNNHFASLFGEIVYFPLVSFLSGFLGGLIFPLANKIYIAERKEGAGRAAGLTYGLDLLGACFGAVLSAVFLIPILGIFKTCLFIALLNLTCLIMLVPILKKS
jgi:spermidine synthase